jgi:hypothetical protein
MSPRRNDAKSSVKNEALDVELLNSYIKGNEYYKTKCRICKVDFDLQFPCPLQTESHANCQAHLCSICIKTYI